MGNIKYCYLCLELNVKLSRMTTPTLECYSRIIRLPLCIDEPYICYECSGLLLKYQQFHTKCTRAHNVLSHLKLQCLQITKKALDVNRKLYNLESKLSQSPICNEEIDPQGDFNNKMESSLSFKVESIDCQHDDQDVSNNIELLHAHVNISEDTKPSEYVDCLHELLDDNDQIVQTERLNLKLKTKPEEEKDIFSEEDNEYEVHPKELPKTTTSRKRKTTPNEEKDIYITNLDEELSKKPKVMHGDISISKNGEFDASFCEGYVEVVLLTPEEAKNEVLLRKQTKNYITSPFTCDLCYRGFLSKTTFDNHMKKHSQSYGSLECHYCLMRYPKRRLLMKHITNHHLRKFKCLKCEHVCFQVCQVKAHIKAHEGSRYPCNECDKQFSLQNTLLNHKHKKHPKECVCALCGSAFGTQHGLLLHRQFTHKEESLALSGPRCAECTMQFATETAYRRHLVISDKHKGAVSNGCDVCGNTFANREDLRIHSQVHGTKRKRSSVWCMLPIGFPPPPAKCPLCDKWLSTVKEVKAHLTSEHPHSDIVNKISAAKTCQEKKQYACDYCREQFQNTSKRTSNRITSETHAKAPQISKTASKRGSAASSRTTVKSDPYVCELCGEEVARRRMIKYHLLKHTGERPLKCEECGKGFARPSTLYLHRASHESRRAFQCHVCPRAFKRKNTLETHLKRTHSDVRPHKCDICHKGFLHPCEVRQHKRYTHEKVPWPSKKTRKQAADNEAER